MKNTFEIGETVVCINAKRRWYKLGGLQKNEMYTVTGFNPYDGGLILKEVKSPTSAYHAFASNRFRKVDYAFAERVLAELQPQVEPKLQPQVEPKLQPQVEPKLQPQFKKRLKQKEYALSILN